VTEFTLEEKKLIYNAVRNFQMNRVALNGKEYQICDGILNKLFTETKLEK
jgi:hypothetical protein